MKSSIQIRAQLAENTARAHALGDLVKAENREGFSDEETAEIARLTEEQKVLNASLDSAIKYETLVSNRMPKESFDKREKQDDDARKTVPIRFKSSFRKGVFATAEDAYTSGQFILATIGNNRKAREWCKENGVPLVRNAMGTGDNTKGGFLTPEPLQNSIIELREQYGVFARYAGQWNMASGRDSAPKVNGEITSYYVGEGAEITASDMSFGLVSLEARKLASLTAVNSEINEDSVVSLAEVLARSIASKFAYDEDNAGFNGDGTSTYGGIVGAKSALAAGSIIDATTGIDTLAEVTMVLFENAVGKLKEYPGIQPAWFVHKNTWANVMQRLLNALGGNTNMDVAAGAPMMFLGYPVVTSQVLYNGAGAVSTIIGYFGDLRMTSYIGRRRGMTIASDSSIYFHKDQIAIRATQRYDINVYDRGTASDSGGLIALKLSA